MYADVHERVFMIKTRHAMTCGLEWGMQAAARCIHGNLVSVQRRANNHYGLCVCVWERETMRPPRKCVIDVSDNYAPENKILNHLKVIVQMHHININPT